jgi:hypothetical protein
MIMMTLRYPPGYHLLHGKRGGSLYRFCIAPQGKAAQAAVAVRTHHDQFYGGVSKEVAQRTPWISQGVGPCDLRHSSTTQGTNGFEKTKLAE